MGKLVHFLKLASYINKLGLDATVKRIEDFSIDPLTGAFNRRSIEKRKRAKVAVVFIDIDGFKKINDQGYKKGDEMLKIFAKTLKSSIREKDICVRYGGDEFLLILPKANKDDANKAIERIYSKSNELFFPLKFSYGIVVGNGDEIFQDLIEKACKEQEIYKKNKKGRF